MEQHSKHDKPVRRRNQQVRDRDHGSRHGRNRKRNNRNSSPMPPKEKIPDKIVQSRKDNTERLVKEGPSFSSKPPSAVATPVSVPAVITPASAAAVATPVSVAACVKNESQKTVSNSPESGEIVDSIVKPGLDEWDEQTIFREPDKVHHPDETGTPLPATYTEDVMLPRKWNATCCESLYVKSDNVEDFILPIRKSKFWEEVKDDPAFVKNGRLPSGEAVKDIVFEKPLPEEPYYKASEERPGTKRRRSLSPAPALPAARRTPHRNFQETPLGGRGKYVDSYRPRNDRRHSSISRSDYGRGEERRRSPESTRKRPRG